MKNSTLKTNLNANTLGLLFAALASAGAAQADHRYDGGHAHHNRERGAQVSGTVEITKEIPGGIITVGGTFGHPRPVIVEERKVVIVEREDHCEAKQVVIIKEAPRREVVVIRERPVERVVIIKTKGRHGKVIEKRIITRGHDRHDRRDHDDRWDRDDRDDRHDHGDRWDRDDRHDYGDRRDDRGGMNRHVYVQK